MEKQPTIVPSAPSSPSHLCSESSRGISPSSPACRRPRLTRSSATEPSLATSYASRKDLVGSLHPATRATALLSRVASYSNKRPGQEFGLAPPKDGRKSASPRRRSPHSDGALVGKEDLFSGHVRDTVQGGYFSFPSFDDFLDTPSLENNEGRKSSSIELPRQ